jgi:hypothetical protein
MEPFTIVGDTPQKFTVGHEKKILLSGLTTACGGSGSVSQHMSLLTTINSSAFSSGILCPEQMLKK